MRPGRSSAAVTGARGIWEFWASAWIALLGLAFLGRAYLASGSEASAPLFAGSSGDPAGAPRPEEPGSSDPFITRR